MRWVVWLGFVALAGTGPSSALAQAGSPPKPPQAAPAPATGGHSGSLPPSEDAAAASEAVSPDVVMRSVGLFLPDARWQQLKTGVPKLEVGTWVEYTIEHPEMNLGRLRLSVVPQHSLPGPSWRILELRLRDATGESTYIKAAFPRSTTDLREAKELVFKAAGMPPLVLPLSGSTSNGELKDVGFTVRAVYSPTQRARVTYLGKEKIHVPAGTFRTWHYRFRGRQPDGTPYVSEYWFDVGGSVPVLRLVRARTGTTVLNLAASGTGAKSDLPYLMLATE